MSLFTHVDRIELQFPLAREPIADIAMQLDLFEQQAGFALPAALRDFFQKFAASQTPESLKLLPLAEATRLLDNWPRYGFSSDRGYVPIAEDQNGDLFAVACAEPWRGQVFHLAWAGEEEPLFENVESFLKTVGGRR
jgi:hypothetical protein